MRQQDASLRCANKWAEATFGYANAGLFAGFHAANIALEHWANVFDQFVGAPPKKTKSWFRHPDEAAGPTNFVYPGPQMTPAFTSPETLANFTSLPWMFSGQVWSGLMAAIPDAVRSNPAMAPFSAAATVWPATCWMVAMGWPHNVAKPTAEANAAAYEAFESAKQMANQNMAAYSTVFSDPGKPDADKRSSNPADPNDPFALFRAW